MRAMIKTGGKWQQEEPEDLLRWMWKQDGEEALVIDDSTEPKTYYCGSESLMEECRKTGKVARMFYGLCRRLFDQQREREWEGNNNGEKGGEIG